MTAIPVFTLLVFAEGKSLTAWKQLEALDWLALCGESLAFILFQIFLFKAMQNQQAAKLQPFMFLMPAWQFVADVVLFSAVFNEWQVLGLVIVLSVFVVELIYIYFIKTEAK